MGCGYELPDGPDRGGSRNHRTEPNIVHMDILCRREEYYDAIINWQKTRNHVEGLTKECIGYENGVLGGVVSALNVFCSRRQSASAFSDLCRVYPCA